MLIISLDDLVQFLPFCKKKQHPVSASHMCMIADLLYMYTLTSYTVVINRILITYMERLTTFTRNLKRAFFKNEKKFPYVVLD